MVDRKRGRKVLKRLQIRGVHIRLRRKGSGRQERQNGEVNVEPFVRRGTKGKSEVAEELQKRRKKVIKAMNLRLIGKG